MGSGKRPIQAASIWVKRQPPKVKAFLAVLTGMAALVLLRAIVHDDDNLFVAGEAVHSIGICVLIYKLTKEKTCAGNNPIRPSETPSRTPTWIDGWIDIQILYVM